MISLVLNNHHDLITPAKCNRVLNEKTTGDGRDGSEIS